MHVASLDLCKELYGLSGWPDPNNTGFDIPAYDLGYLLRKLPAPVTLFTSTGKRWQATFVEAQEFQDVQRDEMADTPEDAAAKLAIELHRQGVLPGERGASQKASPDDFIKELDGLGGSATRGKDGKDN